MRVRFQCNPNTRCFLPVDGCGHKGLRCSKVKSKLVNKAYSIHPPASCNSEGRRRSHHPTDLGGVRLRRREMGASGLAAEQHVPDNVVVEVDLAAVEEDTGDILQDATVPAPLPVPPVPAHDGTQPNNNQGGGQEAHSSISHRLSEALHGIRMPQVHMPQVHMPQVHMPHFHVPHPHLPRLHYATPEEGKKHTGLHFTGQFMRMRNILHHKVANAERAKAENSSELAYNIAASQNRSLKRSGSRGNIFSPEQTSPNMAPTMSGLPCEVAPGTQGATHPATLFQPGSPGMELMASPSSPSLSPVLPASMLPLNTSPLREATSADLSEASSDKSHPPASPPVLRLTRTDYWKGLLFMLCIAAAVFVPIFWKPHGTRIDIHQTRLARFGVSITSPLHAVSSDEPLVLGGLVDGPLAVGSPHTKLDLKMILPCLDERHDCIDPTMSGSHRRRTAAMEREARRLDDTARVSYRRQMRGGAEEADATKEEATHASKASMTWSFWVGYPGGKRSLAWLNETVSLRQYEELEILRTVVPSEHGVSASDVIYLQVETRDADGIAHSHSCLIEITQLNELGAYREVLGGILFGAIFLSILSEVINRVYSTMVGMILVAGLNALVYNHKQASACPLSTCLLLFMPPHSPLSRTFLPILLICLSPCSGRIFRS
jgi:hypothetical protein